jgi:hypothetical protein
MVFGDTTAEDVYSLEPPGILRALFGITAEDWAVMESL